jgi:hypothetical protein
MEQGGRFRNDDLTPVYLTDGATVAVPSVTLYPKLCRTSLERFRLDWRHLLNAPPERDDFWLPIRAERRSDEEAPLSLLVVLSPAPILSAYDGTFVERLSPEAAATTIAEHVAGMWAFKRVVSEERVSALSAALAAAVPVFVVHYFKRFEVLPELVRTIQTLVGQQKKPARE